MAVVTLKAFDAHRYAAISWKNPLAVDDPKNCAVRGDGTKETESGLVWDMHTQVAQWLRSADATNSFRYGEKSSRANRLYGWGYSQTGRFLFTYINAIQPLVIAKDGKSPFDGYMVAISPVPRRSTSALNAFPQAIRAGRSAMPRRQ